MKKRSFIFTNKKHPLISIMSSILGAISLVSYLYAIIYSFNVEGVVSIKFGVAGVLSMIYSLVGFIMALMAFKLKEVFHLFTIIGLVLNGMSLIVAVFLLWLPS